MCEELNNPQLTRSPSLRNISYNFVLSELHTDNLNQINAYLSVYFAKQCPEFKQVNERELLFPVILTGTQ